MGTESTAAAPHITLFESTLPLPQVAAETSTAPGRVEIICASAFALPLPDESVQMVVTSPPYFNLRQYAGDTDSSFGHERTVGEYVSHTMDALREIRRVLRPDGVVFWVVGDSYGGGGQGGGGKNACRTGRKYGPAKITSVPPKNLCLVPERVVIAAQDDGWIIRDIVVWQKPNCLPESVRDRCTRSYEVIFMLVKQKKYYWNQDAREPAVSKPGTLSPPIGNAKHKAMGKATLVGNRVLLMETRRPRNVWTIPAGQRGTSHVATFPLELASKCILCGSRPGDLVLDPFGGSGTTGLAARELGRNAVLVEVSEEYARLAAERVA
jgi:DNA modification methylase